MWPMYRCGKYTVTQDFILWGGGGVYQRMNNGLPGRCETIQLPPKPYCVWAYREITGDIGVSIIKEGG